MMIEQIADKFNSGGPFMWVLLTTLGVGCAVIIERLIYYFIYCNGDNSSLVNNVINKLRKNSIDEALKILGKKKSPLLVLIRSAIDNYAKGRNIEIIQQEVEVAAVKEVPKISKRLNYLSLIANIATLIGLLGTIAGLQVSFGSLSTVDIGQKSVLLANGIAQAMNTTAFGLIVAVPCMVMFTILNNRKKVLVENIDESVIRILNYMKEKI